MFDNFVFPNENLFAETMDFDLISWTGSINNYMDNIATATQCEQQQVMELRASIDRCSV